MHVAVQLFPSAFEVEPVGDGGSPDGGWDEWSVSDRFGVVVDEPLGGLGASLLIQLAIVSFYEADPRRRATEAIYPEIYLFHVGGPHGDYSNFDFWPPRKEVVTPAGQPLRLLEAINDRAITRLALPQRPAGNVDVLGEGPSTWAEVAAARERLASCFLYDSSGQASDATFRISTTDARAKENIVDTMAMTSQLPRPVVLGSASDQRVIDERRWIDVVAQRLALEEPVDNAALAVQQSHFRPSGELLRQSYRRVTSSEALARLSSL